MSAGTTLMQLLYEHADARPGADAIVHRDERIAFGELIERVERLASSLAERGVGAGDAVGLVLRDDPWFVTSLLAVTGLGGIAVPVNPAFKQSEIEFCFHSSEVRAVISDERAAGVCSHILAGLDAKAEVFTTTAAHGQASTLESLVEAGDAARLAARDPEQAFVFQFSSGSTGRPKRMVRTHGQCAAEAGLYAALGFTSADTVLGTLPLFHNWGLGSCVFSLAATGARLVLLEDPHPFLLRRHRALELIERERVTIFPGVPFNYRLMAEAPADADLSSLRLCFSAGTALPRPVFEAFGERFGVLVRQLYGTTETGAIAANMGDDPVATFDSVGAPIGDVRVEILDEDGDALPAGEEGEVAVASPAMTAGYAGAGMAELNRAAFRDGRFLTGDLGILDEQGLLRVTGRKKLLIEVGGFKVDPIEVEDAIADHPQIAEATVVGVPGEVQGEEVVKAAVVPEGALDERELTAFCRERLANYKIPQVIEFREEIPKSPLGKILRKHLVSS